MLAAFRSKWLQRILRDEAPPPILVGVPGALLGIAVPTLPRPGRLYIVAPYDCSDCYDPIAVRGMLATCARAA